MYLIVLARRTTGYSESEYESMNPLLSRPLRDEDLPENKYKRRAPSEWLSRWLRLVVYFSR